MLDDDDEPELPTESVAFSPQRVTSFVLSDATTQRAYAVAPDAPSRMLIGTSVACDVVIDDRTVSRRHAAVDVHQGALRVTDLKSTNGTWLNGTRIVEAYAAPGDVLKVGERSLRVEATRGEVSVAEGPGGARLRSSFGRFVGASAALQRLYPKLERLAQSDIAVLIEGETGTGKEVLAEALHEASARRDAPYVVFDCTAIAPSLMEAELFGYERAAFTGATTSKPGLVEIANGGTLLIDEIGDLDLSLQPKLLRVLDRGEVRRLGGRESIRVDVRFLAATRRDLDAEVAAGRFRDDLFHRVVIGRVELPPLRERVGDVELLARHFAAQLGAQKPLPDELLRKWAEHAWPGNVRELRASVARYLALGEELVARPMAPSTDDDVITRIVSSGLTLHEARREVLAAFERSYVEALLARTQGNVSRAAELAGIARRNFQVLKAKVRDDTER